MKERKVTDLSEMISRHREAVKKKSDSRFYPAGHNLIDDDLAKVQDTDVIGKAQSPSEVLKK